MSTKTTWNRVWQYPSARIEPLDASTTYEASSCRVWEGGSAVAVAKRCGRHCWGVYVPGQEGVPSAMGASVLEAVTQWLTLRERLEQGAAA